jgi:Transglycosylase
MSVTRRFAPSPPPRETPWLRNRWLWLSLLALAVLVAWWVLPGVAERVAAARLRDTAADRGLTARWGSLRVSPLGRCRVTDLTLTGAAGDTVLHARDLQAALSLGSLLLLNPRLSGVELRDARIRARTGRADADSLESEDELPSEAARKSRVLRLQRMLDSGTRLLLAPARKLPPVELERVTFVTGDSSSGPGVSLDRLVLEHPRDGSRVSAAGTFHSDRPVVFSGDLVYRRDDRLEGSAALIQRRPADDVPETLSVAIRGTVRQERGIGLLTLADDTRLEVGDITWSVSGSVQRAGPRFTLALAADSLTQDRIRSSIPSLMLGRLSDVSVRGSFDYRLSIDLDFDRPEDMEFRADVLPNGLRLDPSATRLRLTGLDAPFNAAIHLPRGRVEHRELSPINPHFRPLEAIDSVLIWSVVTNEDGGFFRHRGFNVDAVKASVAENIRAGAYRRGAGTITMQLARNLYLGHDRTLSRKFQEVVLAWILEHLAGASKRRLLEIYLNIIEWGPEVHGADEAAHYYFGHDAGKLTTSEALFLATVIPAPRKWRWRFDEAGALRPYARDQMHFIGRAMIAKGVLPAGALPPADSLRVELEGRARDVVFPRAESDSLAAPLPEGVRAPGN